MCVWSPTWIFKGHFFFAVVLLSLFTAVFPPSHYRMTTHSENGDFILPKATVPCAPHVLFVIPAVGYRRGGAEWEFIYCFFISLKCGDTHAAHDPLFCLSITGTTVHKKPPPARLSRCQSSSSAKINNIRQKGRKKANKKIKINNMSKEINKASKLHRWWLEGGLISCLSPSISHPSFNVCLTQ